MTVEVDVQYATQVREVPRAEQIADWVSAALRGDTPAELSVRIVDEPESATLNETYRNRGGPTNVLSFPADAPAVAGANLLGDVVICAPLVIAQAREQHKSSGAHFAHLVVHGTLHLQGFDHENDADAARMEAVEVDILARLGYSNPYEAGDSAAD